MAHDPTNQNFITPFGGRAQVMVNRSGGPIAAGEVVELSAQGERAFRRAIAGSPGPFGISYENVDDGSECWVVIDGLQDVLLDSSGGCSFGQSLCMSPTEDGRVRVGFGGAPVGMAVDGASAGAVVQISVKTVPIGVGSSYVSVKSYGAMGDGITDDTLAIQSAIDAAAGGVVYLPAGRYVIASQLSYVNNTGAQQQGLQMIGAGTEKTIFESRVAGVAMLLLNGDVADPYSFQFNGRLKYFSIDASATPAAGGHGIEFWSNWQLNIEAVRVTGLDGDGIRSRNTNGDLNSSNFVTIKDCYIYNNSGYGFFSDASVVPGSASSRFVFDECYIAGNGLGGIKTAVSDPIMIGGAIAYNGGIGFHSTNEATATKPDISHVEFDGNTTAHVRIDKCYAARLAYNSYKAFGSGSAFKPQYDVVVGDAADQCANAVIDHSHVRVVNPTAQPHTAFVLGAQSVNARIIDTLWQVFAAPAVKFSDAGVGTVIRDMNMRNGDAILTRTQNIDTSYTPDMSTGVYHRISVTAGPNFIVNNPTSGVAQGRELILDIINSSGAPLNVTFGADIATAAAVAVAAGRRRTCRFIYEPNGAQWIQIGDWSADFI